MHRAILPALAFATLLVIVDSALATDLDNVVVTLPASLEIAEATGGTGAAPLVPATIAFQGFLTDDIGVPITGTVDLAFAIYDEPAGGTSLWDETQPGVVVSEGVFAAALGAATPIPAAIFDDDTTYLGIRVDGEPELTPRTQLRTSPYAFKALDADKLGGLGSGDYVKRAGDTMTGPLGLNGGVEGLLGGGVTEIVDSETDVAVRQFFYASGGGSDAWTDREARVILSFNGNGDVTGGGAGTATVAVDASSPVEISISAGGNRPWTYIVETGPLNGSGSIDVLVRATSAASPVLIRSIVLETDDAGTGAAGNTLDQAYDEGGPGAGRSITADSGPVEIRGDLDLGRAGITDGDIRIYSDTSAFPVARLTAVTRGADLALFEEDGTLIGGLEPDAAGSGGFFVVSGGVSLSSFIIDGSGGVNGSPRVTIDGPAADFAFDTNVFGNDSAVLPQDAISSPEILDEPGISQDQVNGNVTIASATMTDVVVTQISVPTSGYVVVTASAQARLSGTSGARMALQIDETSGGDLDQDHYYYVGNTASIDGLDYRPVQVQRTYFKGPGIYDFRFEALINLGSSSALWNPVITAEFFPTAYGTVLERVTDAELGEFSSVSWRETGTNGPDTVSRRSALVDLRELERRVARVEAENARLRQELIEAELREQSEARAEVQR